MSLHDNDLIHEIANEHTRNVLVEIANRTLTPSSTMLGHTTAEEIIHREIFLAIDAYKEKHPNIDDVMKENATFRAALEKLAKLGMEPNYGNSIGNDIAQRALGIK